MTPQLYMSVQHHDDALVAQDICEIEKKERANRKRQNKGEREREREREREWGRGLLACDRVVLMFYSLASIRALVVPRQWAGEAGRKRVRASERVKEGERRRRRIT